MFLRRVRRTGRVFAVALLLWTAMDVLDRRICASQPGLLAPAQSTVSVDAALPGGGAAGDRDGCPPGYSGDCFCCSAFVDVKVPFVLELRTEFVRLPDAAAPGYSSIPRQPTYRPPIPA